MQKSFFYNLIGQQYFLPLTFFTSQTFLELFLWKVYFLDANWHERAAFQVGVRAVNCWQ